MTSDYVSGDGAEKRPGAIDVLRSILTLAAPTVAVLSIQILVGVAETYYVGRLGTSALAGAAMVAPLLALMTMMSNGGVGGGVASAVARAMGAGRKDEANALASQAAWLGLLFGALFSVGAIVLGPAIYRALGGSGEALSAALAFGAAVFASAIASWILNLLAAALRGAGDVKTPALITLAGAVIIIPLSPLLIFGLGPVPGFGIAGAGIAVALYNLGACGYMVFRMRGPKSALTLRFMLPKSDLLRRIMHVGGPAALSTVVVNLTTVVLTGAAGAFGASALAGYGVASRLDFLLIPLLFGLGTAVTTLVGRSIGAGDAVQAKRIAWTGAVLAVAVTETIGLLVAWQPHVWMGLFSHSAEVISFGGGYLRIVAPSYGFLGLGFVLYFASHGAGHVTWPFVATVARLVIAACVAWLAITTVHLGFAGVAVAMVAGAIVDGVGCALAVRFTDWGVKPAASGH